MTQGRPAIVATTAIEAVPITAGERSIDVSIVLPAFNERGTVAGSAQELSQMMDTTALEYELLFVDDGSTDGTWDEIRRLAATMPNVRGLRHRGNSGKASALANGFAYARGEVVVMCDADLQYEPEDVLRIIDKVYEGFDAVTARKTVRTDGFERKFASRMFNGFLRRATGVQLHDMNAGLKAFRYQASQELIRFGYGELHRFFMVILALRGFTVAEVEVESRPRESGTSKYGMERYLRGGLDYLTVVFLSGYLERPLHLFGGIGLGIAALGTFVFLAGLVWGLITGAGFSMVGFAAATIAVLSGVQLFGIGLVAEMLNNLEHGPRPTARLSEAIGVERSLGGDFMPPLVVRRRPRDPEVLSACGVSIDEEHARTVYCNAEDDGALTA